MYVKPTRVVPASREGLAFELPDLQAAMAWAESTPHVRLYIRLDCVNISEAIEICPPGSSFPRWFLWRTHDGQLRVDDWGKHAFGLPYTTVETALRFITAEL
jgi:hypothetical protein